MRKGVQMYVSLILSAIPLLSMSQGQPISLEEALQMADKNNLQTQSARAQESAARGSYRMTNAVFLPGISLSNTAVSTNDPLSSFGFKLKQEVVTQEDFNPGLLNDPGSMENYSTKIELKQPLLNLDGIYARKAAKSQYEASSLQSQRIRQNIRYEVKKAYYSLELARSSVDVLEQSVDVAKDALRLTEDNEQQGFVKHADVLEAKVRLENRQNQLRQAQNQVQMANEYLAHLLGLELSVQLETTDSLLQEPAFVFAQQIPGDLQNRTDIQAFQKQINASEDMLRSQRMKFVPRVNAFGSYEFNDKNFPGTSAGNYMVGASLSWDLFNGYKNIASVQHAKAQLDEVRYNYQDYLSQSQMQLNRTKRNIEMNYELIQSGKLSKEQAEESLRIRTNRFEQGLEKTTDVLMSEALVSQKRLEYIQAIYNYKQSIFQLELLLEKNINQ